MFKVVALAYVFFAGQSVDPPLVFNSARSFPARDACQLYLASEDFGMARARLTTVLTAALLKPPVNVDVDKDGPLAIPAVAITASCEEDDRL